MGLGERDNHLSKALWEENEITLIQILQEHPYRKWKDSKYTHLRNWQY